MLIIIAGTNVSETNTKNTAQTNTTVVTWGMQPTKVAITLLCFSFNLLIMFACNKQVLLHRHIAMFSSQNTYLCHISVIVSSQKRTLMYIELYVDFVSVCYYQSARRRKF